jgi:hypothetical protein
VASAAVSAAVPAASAVATATVPAAVSATAAASAVATAAAAVPGTAAGVGAVAAATRVLRRRTAPVMASSGARAIAAGVPTARPPLVLAARLVHRATGGVATVAAWPIGQAGSAPPVVVGRFVAGLVARVERGTAELRALARTGRHTHRPEVQSLTW